MSVDLHRGLGVLVTGGLGFIGSRLALRLVRDGARVTIVDTMDETLGANPWHTEELRDSARIIVGDIRDPSTVRDIVGDQQVLFNLAGLVSHMDSMRWPAEDLDVNVRGQLVLLEACRAHNPGIRFVHASTRQVYGRAMTLPVTESHPLCPPDINGVNKLAGEGYVRVYHEVHGLRATTLRLSNTYGPGMRIRDGKQTFLGIWIRAALEGTPFEVWGGGQERDLVFVDDVVEAFLATAQSDATVGEAYNVAGREVLSLSALAERLSLAAGGAPYRVIDYPAERLPIEIGDYASDCTKIASAVGWTPQHSMDLGLAKTLAYYREHVSHYV